MAAGSITLYQANIDDISIDMLAGATIKMSLHTSSYTPNAGTSGHSLAADLTDELPAGNGYSTGGVTLASPAKTAIANGWKFSTGNATWTASGNFPAWRYGVLRVEGTLSGKTNPIIGYFVGDTTPADVPVTTDGNPLTVQCPADGWFDIVAE
jgi:hypothetical protein